MKHSQPHCEIFFFIRMDRLKEAVGVFTSCLERNPFFLDGIIARGNVYMDYGSQGGIIYARYWLM